jgi:CRP-like cAMP-binding protein
MPMPTYRNTILKSLPDEVIQRLRLRPVKFRKDSRIESPGEPIKKLYFVEVGMASMTTTFLDGWQIEVGMFGYEGVIGVSALMGTKLSLNRIYTQIDGRGFSSPIEAGRAEFQRGGAFQTLALRYVQAQLITAIQSVSCNARHNFDQRLARWLLLCADRANSDHFRITHEYLGHMLGSTRSTVSIAAAHMQDDGLIEYKRGSMRIVDANGLEIICCECYRIIKNHLDSYAEFTQ